MNPYSLRVYWTSKYEDNFEESYPNDRLYIELAQFKRLLKNFNQYIILEAIDQFFSYVDKDKASISLFSSNNYFTSRFSDLIKEKDIIKYKRLLPWYSTDNQTIIKSLVQRYNNYIYALSINKEDLEDMEYIVNRLESIEMEK